MRRFLPLLALLAVAAVPVSAQTPPVTNAQPPVMVPLDDSNEPQVTIRRRDGDTIEEYRVNGILTKVVVTPQYGLPYTLVDQKGDGTLTPLGDGLGTPQLSVPMWTIHNF